ncbi:MAG: hypothetical protein LUG18_01905 [Candidatus Azobacteroides sp.]|nr:hypothetical protein [Candidatus Azobacteroides sp.]
MKEVKRYISLLLIAIGITGFLQAQEQIPVALTLEEALEIAMNENPTIKIAEKEVEKQNYAKKET